MQMQCQKERQYPQDADLEAASRAQGLPRPARHHAADALVALGERPTVERIRAHLGTGPPNTVVRHLDSWWVTLGARLQAERGSASVPDAPRIVIDLASQLWESALSSARSSLEEELQEARTAISLERQALDSQAASLRDQAQTALRSVEAAERAKNLVEHRLADMMALVTELQARTSDLEAQRDAAQVQADQRQEALTAYLDQWQRREDDLANERRRQTEYVRALEGRAYGEVDRVRQELGILGKRMDAAARAHAVSESALKATVDRLTLGLTSA